MKKIISVYLALILAINPLLTANAKATGTYSNYLDQAENFSEDYTIMLQSIKKLLFNVGDNTICPNFTWGYSNTHNSAETFAKEFTAIIESSEGACLKGIFEVAEKYNVPFYGHGQMLEWLRDFNLAYKANPELLTNKEATEVEQVVKTPIKQEPKPKTDYVTTPIPEKTINTEIKKEIVEIPVITQNEPKNPSTESTNSVEATDTEDLNKILMSDDIDGDGLSNKYEIEIGTNPYDQDTDNDLVNDNEEINRNLNPLNPDTDQNGYSDNIQISIESNTNLDDNDQNSVPDILDEELLNNLDIKIDNGYNDTDGDGLSDAYEAIIGSNILSNNNKDSKIYLDQLYFGGGKRYTSVKARIVNYENNAKTVDTSPVIKGVAHRNSTVTIVARTANGNEILGTFESDEENKFIGELSNLKYGKYELSGVVKAKSGTTIDTIPSITIEIVKGKSSEVTTPKIESFGKAEIKSNKKIQLINVRKPVLKGYAKPGSYIEAYFKSLILSSAVIADAQTGYFEISPNAELEDGDHEVWLYSTDPKTKTKSENEYISFNLSQNLETTVLNTEESSKLYILLLGAFIAIVGSILVYQKRKKKA